MQFIVGASGEILELFCVLFQFRIRTKHVPHNLRRVRSPIKSKGKNRILQEWQDWWRLSATVQNKYVDIRRLLEYHLMKLGNLKIIFAKL